MFGQGMSREDICTGVGAAGGAGSKTYPGGAVPGEELKDLWCARSRELEYCTAVSHQLTVDNYVGTLGTKYAFQSSWPESIFEGIGCAQHYRSEK